MAPPCCPPTEIAASRSIPVAALTLAHALEGTTSPCCRLSERVVTAGESRRVTGDPQRGWKIVTTLAVTEPVSWGVLYYAFEFAVFLTPMRSALGLTTSAVSGAFSLALRVSALQGSRPVVISTGTVRDC